MSKKSKKTLLPKLRFPEYKDAEEWQLLPFKEVYAFKSTNSFSREQLDYSVGSVKNIHYGDIHKRFSTLFDIQKELVPFIANSKLIEKVKTDSYCVEGDIVFADASEDLEDIGKNIEIFNLNNEKILSGLHTILARQKRINLVRGFGGYLFKSDGIRSQIKKEAQGTKVLGISAGRISNIKIYFPKDEKEQKKIVECLSSIDDLIISLSKKIDALKDHKNGVMQQLFPVEDETVPKLRFPEFLNAGRWEQKAIGSVLKEQLRPINMLDKQDYTLVTVKRRYGGVVPRSVSQGESIKVKTQFLIKKNDFLISKRQIVHCACGLVPEYLDGSIVSNEYSILVAKKNNDITFFNYFSQQPEVSQSFLQCSSGIVIEKMLFKLNDWLKKEFLFPSLKEQQKIASFLLNLDQLIDNLARQLETIEIYKTGLMQQLFPSIDEASK